MNKLITANEATGSTKGSIKLAEMEKVFEWFNAKVSLACRDGKFNFSVSEYSWRDSIGDGIRVFEKEISDAGFSIDKQFKGETDIFNHGKPENIKMVTVSWKSE